MSLYERQCPQCKETTSKFHLMMNECDDCINKNAEFNRNAPDKYITSSGGILVLNPKWTEYYGLQS